MPAPETSHPRRTDGPTAALGVIVRAVVVRAVVAAALAALVVVAGAAPARAAPPPTPPTPPATPGPTSREAALDLAWQHHEGHRYAACARALDALAPSDAWVRIGAAECWALAGELGNAEGRLIEALGDPTLREPGRSRAEALMARVRAATPHAARARASPPIEAAPAWDAAFAASDVGHFLVLAGLAWETARRPREAVAALRAALRRDDVPADEAAALPVRLAALEAQLPPPPPDRTAAWITTALGAATLAFGASAFIVAEVARDDVRDALVRPVVTGMTRVEALAAQDRADTWNVVGWVAVGAGLAVATTGLALFTLGPRAPEGEGTVRVGAAPTAGGALLVTGGRF